MNIKAVARMTNLSVDTIRAWERRYRAIKPDRTDNGRRAFSSEDVERLILLRKISAAGMSISRIAALSNAQLRDLMRLATQNGDADDAGALRIVKAIRSRNVTRLSEELLHTALICSPAEFGDDIIAAVVTELERDADTFRTSELLLACSLASISSTLFAKYRRRGAPVFVSLGLPGSRCATARLIAALVASQAGFDGVDIGTPIPARAIAQLLRDLNAVGAVVTADLSAAEEVAALAGLQHGLPQIDFVFMGCGDRAIHSGLITARSFRELSAFLEALPRHAAAS